VASSYGAPMTISPSIQPLRVAPSLAHARLRLVGAPTDWGADVRRTPVASLAVHPLSDRIQPLSTAERAALRRDVTARGVLTQLDVTTDRVIPDNGRSGYG